MVLGAGGVTAAGVLTDASLRGAFQGITLYRRGIAPLVVFSGSRADGALDEASARAALARGWGKVRAPPENHASPPGSRATVSELVTHARFKKSRA